MEQLREVAVAYYNGSSAEDRQLARQFFSALDLNGDGRVSLAEFKKVIGSDDSTNKYFAAFDQNGDGVLDLTEFLTLYYSIKAEVRSCDGCNKLLPGSYFSCLLCEIDYPKCYDLCCACYGGGKFSHHHSTDKFLDDRSMRMLFIHSLKQEKNITVSSSSRAVQRNSSSRDAMNAFEMFSSGISIGNTVYTLGSIAVTTGCIIM